MQHLKTEQCVICGNKAVIWYGHVIAKEKMALGNYIDKKVVSGFCEKHKDYEIEDETGFYGNYDSTKMGKCIPVFGN